MSEKRNGVVVAVLAVALGAGVAAAQEKPADPPAELPGLDELLDLPGPGESDPASPADALRRELEDKLTGQQIAERFDEAVRLMRQTADRLQAARDTGLATQRLQEDVIRKLDALIDAAKKQQQQQSKSSSSQSRQNSRPQPNQPQSQQQQAGSGENRDQVDPPARRTGDINPQVDQNGAAWGALPAHVREALSQGFSDPYSSLYGAMTAAYYRRLAEEAGK